MASKKYRIQTACPQCGCSGLTVLTAEEMEEKYGILPNAEMECSECMAKFQTKMKTACPEWDADCKLKE